MSIRNRRLNISIVTNFFLKGTSILINLAFVPLMLSSLGKEKYGIWLTIYAFISWLTMFDLGIGNGLRIHLTEAFTNRRLHLAKKLISTTYISLSLLISFFLAIFFLASFFIKWDVFFGINNISSYETNISIIITIIAFSIILIIKNVAIIYSSLQLTYFESLFNAIGIFFFFVIMLIINILGIKPNLILVSISASFPLMIVYLLSNLYLFVFKTPSLIPKLIHFSKELLKSVAIPGIGFFIIQICSVILYSTNNILIVNLLTPSDVTDYNITYQYFNLPFILFSLYVFTHWHAFIDALAKNDIVWIKNRINIFKLFFLILSTIYLIMFISFDSIIQLWTQTNDISSNFFLKFSIICYFLVSSLATIYIYPINASGKIRLQVIIYIIIAIINVPLTILFVKYLNLGLSGVAVANTLSLLILAIFIPLQYIKIINKSAKGIWNK